MKFLWLLTESDGEDFIYKALVEKITGLSFQTESRKLIGARGISGVRKNLPLFLNDIKRTGHMKDGFS